MSQDVDPVTGPIDATGPLGSDSVLFGSDNGEEFEFAFDSTTAPAPSPPADTVFVEQPETSIPPSQPQPALPPAAPMARPVGPQDLSRWERRRRVRLQARRVRRIVRHVEPWSVLKISLIFYACLWVILMVAGVLLWSVAVSSGTVENVESFIRDLFALEEFEFNADQIFRGFAFGGLVLIIAGTGFSVLLCVLFNLISDLTGGLRVTVIEEESARFRPRRRRGSNRGRRQRVARAPASAPAPGPASMPPPGSGR